MASMPSTGPNANGMYATGQPQRAAQPGTRWIVSIVSRNPEAVCIVSAVPTYSLGATSATHAENCAESATTEMPQMNATTIVRLYDQVDTGPMMSEHAPLIAIAMMVTRARPIWSARTPAATQPMAPAAITRNASTGAQKEATACSRPT